MARRRSRSGWAYAAARVTVGVVALAAVVSAQRFFGGYGYEPATHNLPYDGRFTFMRLRYTTGPGGYYYRGLPAWAHGFDRAEANLDKILDAITAVHPRLDGSNVATLDDPELDKFPVAYMTEAGFWELNDTEAAGLRAYLEKGGFVIFDDFRPPPRGGGGWDNFESNIRRVIPHADIVALTPADPIFHAFFDIDSFDIIPQSYDGGRPEIYGLYDLNDPNRRMLAVINYNTDISDFWEFSNTGFMPVDESNEAYKIGVNYIIYGLTH
jgi:Domain of unknown function (DUF4159)